jgi:hypothetical protein
MKGRKAFEPGSQKAAAFYASEFRQTGLEPLTGLKDYQQTLTFTA